MKDKTSLKIEEGWAGEANEEYLVRQDPDGTYSGHILGRTFNGLRNLEQAQAWIKQHLAMENEKDRVEMVPVKSLRARANILESTTKGEANFRAVVKDIAGQLAPGSRRVYGLDARHFAFWFETRGLSLQTLTRPDFIDYRRYLAGKYAKTTAARMLTVARRLLDEAVKRGDLAVNPGLDVKGFKGEGDNETSHTALTLREARDLLGVIDRNTLKGKRDYALIMLLLRTGLRRSEAAALQLADLKIEQGHHVLTVRHGKGDKRRKVKLQVDVLRTLSDFLASTNRKDRAPNAPLFIQFRKGDHPVEKPVTDKLIERVVVGYARLAEVGKLTPHGLRASFVTLALEGGAKLQQVQYAAGHADPRTTERYQKRKFNLDDNATDYIKL